MSDLKELKKRGYRWCYGFSVFMLSFVFAKLAIAAGDFSLDSLNTSIKGHISGDFGKLMGLASIGWLIIGSVAGFNVRLLVSVFVLLLAISFGPELVMSVVK
jgi:uncharacterized membrane protein (DUF485 family)